MSNQKKFGVWMETQHATIVGLENNGTGAPIVIAHVKVQVVITHPGEQNVHNHKEILQKKFFNEITSHLQNATYLHATGTGQVQEQFIHHLAETPQFKNTKTEESTSNKMSDEKLLEFFSDKLN